MTKKRHGEEIYYEYEKRGRKIVPTIIAIGCLLGAVLYFLVNESDYLNNILNVGSNESAIEIDENETIMDKNFVYGLRLASLGRYDEAISYFESNDFDTLSSDDQEIVLNTYLKAGKEQKALDLEATFDEKIIDHYIKNDEIDRIYDLKTDSKLIEFEKAILEKDYEKILELHDTERLIMNERRANAVANAFYQVGELEKAVNFTSLMVFDGINMWDVESKLNNNHSVIYVPIASKNISLFPVVVLLFIVLTLSGATFYFVFKKYNEQLVKKNENQKKTEEVDENTHETRSNRNRKKKKLKKTENNQVTELDNETEIEAEEDKYSYHYSDEGEGDQDEIKVSD